MGVWGDYAVQLYLMLVLLIKMQKNYAFQLRVSGGYLEFLFIAPIEFIILIAVSIGFLGPTPISNLC